MDHHFGVLQASVRASGGLGTSTDYIDFGRAEESACEHRLSMTILRVVSFLFTLLAGIFGCAAADQIEQVPRRLAAESHVSASGVSTDAKAKVREPVVRLERFRPWYEVTVSNDGSVTYVGKDFVHSKGVREWTISGPQLQKLIAAAEKIRFSDLSTDYTSPYVADAALAELSYWSDGAKKTVRFHPYAGKAPVVVALREFADLLDATVETKKWICPLPRFNEMFCGKK